MIQFLFTNPLRDTSLCIQEATAIFQKTPGIGRWQLWIQNGPGTTQYCVHYLECQDYPVFAKPTSSIQYHETEKVLDLVIDPTPAEGYELVYMLPLLPKKVAEHKEYCHSAMSERREATVAACKAFGMIHIKKWIQESPQGDYVLYYQKMNKPLGEARKDFLSLKDDPKAPQATKSLREQTGLSFEELSPQVTCVPII